MPLLLFSKNIDGGHSALRFVSAGLKSPSRQHNNKPNQKKTNDKRALQVSKHILHKVNQGMFVKKYPSLQKIILVCFNIKHT
jgi:hypothetical protein